MIRRWNLTVIIILLALVVGIALGYLYRDRYSWLLPNRSNLARTQPDISQEIFRTEVQDILQPQSGLEAASGQAAVYTFTGRVAAVAGSVLTVESPTDATETLDAIDFTLTDTTTYVTLQMGTDENGLPQGIEDEADRTEIQVGDVVAVYTADDIKTTTNPAVTKLQKFSDDDLVVSN